MAIKIKGNVVIDDNENLTVDGYAVIGADATVADDLFVGDNTSIGLKLLVGDGTADSTISIKKANNNTSNHISFSIAQTAMGEIGAQDATWLRINQETNKNIYTPRKFVANNGLFNSSNFDNGLDSNGNLIGGGTQDHYQAYDPVGDFSETNETWTAGKDITGLTMLQFYCYGTDYASNCQYQCVRNTPTSSWRCYGTGEINWGTPLPNDGGSISNNVEYSLATKGSYFRHEVEFSNNGNTIKTREDNNGIRSETSWLAWRN